MLRRSLALLLLCALAGCQDYNFNPVGKCVIQPGSSRIKLASLGTADLLFVIDDSGSMAPEQASLARNFGTFITELKKLQKSRSDIGLEPFEFHVAITTSSVFEGWTPLSGNPACGGQPLQCAIASSHYTRNSTSIACSDKDAACDDLVENYFPSFSGTTACSAGVATAGAVYPQGDFVHAAGNSAVLHFTKDVWGATPDATAKLALLAQQFQQNINVGTCGSGMEQHFEAGRLAVEKALGGKQSGVKADEWPHAGAKLVVVWLGDEDDCSNPNDPTKALAFDSANPGTSQNPGSDVCIADQTSSTHKQFALDRYASYFTGLGRSFGAAFIYSSIPTSCTDEKDASGNLTGNRICTPGVCACQCPISCAGLCGSTQSGECQLDPNCSGKIPALPVPGGSRFGELSKLFRDKGVNTFEASVCDPDWGATLKGIAQLVRPPPGLSLPSQPAATDVALLRIESADGKSSRYCVGPAKSQGELDGKTADWAFVDCKTGVGVFGGQTSSCIAINHATGRCEPNPGESYIAQYLGLVPPEGCTSASDCTAALGPGTWSCCAPGTDSKCPVPTASQRGSCVCGGT